jgi:predicted small secreted protein
MKKTLIKIGSSILVVSMLLTGCSNSLRDENAALRTVI